MKVAHSDGVLNV